MRSNAAGTPLSAVLLLIVANLLIPLAIGIFGKGFFPYKPLLPGLAQYEDHGYGPPAPAPFDRVIFMVVDALRSDFVYVANSGFQFAQSLIRNGAAVPFTAHATSPTVTMPRIKAITTGSIPSFLDVVLNVDEGDKSSSLASQDTWLAQMKARASGKLLLYGDDTWLKLFPDTFDRADGTSSFFVSDFTEVDNNVTRHLAGELLHDDWSVMVLHYLGLDHIGHKGGPRSPNMVPKQREMDGIVRQIYRALDSEAHLASTLLVLCGDHGMNDAGNHGASSAGETSPALVFIAPKLQTALARSDSGYRTSPLAERDDFQFYRTVEQSDLAPTLGALLGFPAPQNNLGAFIPDFLALWPQKRDRVQILMHNGHQILRILMTAFGADLFEHAAPGSATCVNPQNDVEEIACGWQDLVRTAPGVGSAAESDSVNDEVFNEWVAKTVKWLRNAQQTMSGMASNYDMSKMGLGLAAAGSALLLAVGTLFRLLHGGRLGVQGLSSGNACYELAPFAFVNVAYFVMMFASSYVEEEHHFWYWAASAWLTITAVRRCTIPAMGPLDRRIALRTFSFAAALLALRLVRAWNQTGQKFAGEPDLVKTFLRPNPLLLWTLVTCTYAAVGHWMARGFVVGARFHRAAVLPAVVLLVLAAFSFKLMFTFEDSPELVVGSFAQTLVELPFLPALTLVARAWIVFAGLAAAAAAAVYGVLSQKKKPNQKLALKEAPSPSLSPIPPPRAQAADVLLPLFTLLAVTQSRTANIPLFLLFGVIYRFLETTSDSTSTSIALTPAELATATLLLQYTSFFAFGGTNAISSVDLSSAYNGISGFSAAAVGMLIFVSNWAGSIYWMVASVLLMLKQQQQKKQPWLLHAGLLTVYVATSAVAVMAACTALRTHLFVWTVFSPKYLYCIAWSLGMHLGVNLGLGGLLYWLGTLSAVVG